MSMHVCPCKDCIDRVMGCHAVCLKYQIFKDAKDEERAKRNAYKELESARRNIVVEAIKKTASNKDRAKLIGLN